MLATTYRYWRLLMEKNLGLVVPDKKAVPRKEFRKNEPGAEEKLGQDVRKIIEKNSWLMKRLEDA